jgi:hypothetical protein
VTPAALAIWFTLAAAPSSAVANGRYPAGGQLVIDPADLGHMVVRTTFGLAQTFDLGAHWSWVCERALSPDGFLDPEILAMSGGRTAVALPDGLAIGDRSGCQWTRAAGLANDDVIDLVGLRTAPATAYAVAAVRVNGAFHALVSKTTDGAVWSPVGDLLSDAYPLTIEISPSRPQRLYLGAQDANLETAFIQVSDDGGVHWVRHPSPGTDAVYVSAVDPADPDRLYLRSFSPEHNLYVSEDGAETWTLLHASLVPLTAFALSPDGRRIAVGGADGTRIIERTDGDGGSAFVVTAAHPLPVTCLTWTAQAALFACADDQSAGFTVGVSTDAGGTFAPLLRLADLVPAWCPAPTAGAACAGDWCPTATAIGASCAAAVDAASDGDGDAGHPEAGQSVTMSSGGCACRTGDALIDEPWPALRSMAVAALVVLLLVAARRGGRSQPRRPSDH